MTDDSLIVAEFHFLNKRLGELMPGAGVDAHDNTFCLFRNEAERQQNGRWVVLSIADLRKFLAGVEFALGVVKK